MKIPLVRAWVQTGGQGAREGGGRPRVMVGGVLPVVAVRAQGAIVVLVARATIVAIAIVWVVARVGALALGRRMGMTSTLGWGRAR